MVTTQLIHVQASNTGPAPPRRRLRQTTPNEDAAETQAEESDDETAVDDDEQNTHDTDMLIPYLHVAAEPVAVAQEHSNAICEKKYGKDKVNAYAKISGKDWTYYVTDVNIFFGRAPEPLGRQSTAAGADSAQPNTEDPQIHIDLGPSKVVSRTHGELRYSQSDNIWQVHCFGRNGVKVNDKFLKRQESVTINNGAVIAISGTEMLWQPATGKPEIHQMFKDRMLSYQNNEGLDEELGSRHHLAAAQPDAPLPAPAAGTHPYSPYYPPAGSYYGGRPAIAPAPANMARPVTPSPSPTKRAINTGSAKRRSPGYKRGIMMESTEQIDYSLDSSKDIKPSCSYASMITWAILSTEDQSLSLNGIYNWIKDHYAYYRLINSGWQVSSSELSYMNLIADG